MQHLFVSVGMDILLLARKCSSPVLNCWPMVILTVEFALLTYPGIYLGSYATYLDYKLICHVNVLCRYMCLLTPRFVLPYAETTGYLHQA